MMAKSLSGRWEEELYQPVFGSLTRFFRAKAEIGLRISLTREQRHMVLAADLDLPDYAPVLLLNTAS